MLRNLWLVHPDAAARPRWRLAYALFIAVVIPLGLGSRSRHVPLPPFVAAYAGDTLWALVVFLGFGFLLPRLATRRVAVLALGFAFLIEISQLYHAPWIDALRRTLPGQLVLGDTFAWSDLACYTVGVAVGAGGEVLAARWSRAHP